MKITHRVSFRLDEARRRLLENLGFRVPEGTRLPGDPLSLVVIVIADDDPRWPEIHGLGGHLGIAEAQFTEQEIDDAPWLRVRSTAVCGYPQPEADFGYMKLTYDLTEHCARCNIGAKQKAPFRMKKEPQRGRNGIVQMHWLPDELFVAPDVWRQVFEPHGIRSLPVWNRKGQTLDTVVQIAVEERAPVDTEGLTKDTCGACGRTRYGLPVGFHPALQARPMQAVVKTTPWFGAGGGEAFQSILMSRDVVRALRARGVRGATFTPCAASESPQSSPASSVGPGTAEHSVP